MHMTRLLIRIPGQGIGVMRLINGRVEEWTGTMLNVQNYVVIVSKVRIIYSYEIANHTIFIFNIVHF